MPVESATYISQLDVTKPASSDAKAEGDDQLRLLKSTLKNTFPNFTADALAATQLQLDRLVAALLPDASGFVGLGVSTSAWGSGRALEIGPSATGFIFNDSNNMNVGSNAYFNTVWRYQSSGVGASRYAQTSGAHAWFVAPAGTAGAPITFTQAVVIDGSGNLLVGTATSGGDGISLAPRASAGGTSQIAFNRAASATSGDAVAFSNGGTRVGTISYTNTATSYQTSSDYRLKNNQRPLVGSGAFIDALKPKVWDWAQDGSRGVGFIAHEFQAVSPSSVSGEKDALDADGKPIFQSMQASSPEVMANIIAELQSLRARVAALEAA